MDHMELRLCESNFLRKAYYELSGRSQFHAQYVMKPASHVLYDEAGFELE